MLYYILLAFILIGVIWLLWQVFFSVKVPLQTITFYSGGLGSGKSLQLSDTAIKLRNKSKLAHYLLGWIPNKKIKEATQIRKVYSTYPLALKQKKKDFKEANAIRFNRAFCKRNNLEDKFYNKNTEIKYTDEDVLYYCEMSNALSKKHLLGRKKLPERVIAAVDEASRYFPNKITKSDVETTENFRFFRHFTNGNLLMADQSIGDIDKAVRRRINVVYNLSEMRKYFFLFYKIKVDRINYMEDIVQNVNNIQEMPKNYIFGMFGKRKYASRYMKKTYNPADKDENPLKWTDWYITKENKGYEEDVFLN